MLAAPVDSESQRAFRGSFAAFAKRVQRRITLRQALTGASFGLSLGALAALALWALRLGELRPFAAGLGALGGAAGALWANRQRWSEQDVALYLDARLDSHETLITALGARHGAEEPAALSHVVERAASVLGSADPRRVRPRLWLRLHAILPLAALTLLAVSVLPLPAAPKPPPVAPGAERVRVASLKGLERIEALADTRGQNPEQDERLKQLAEQARKLRESLAKGVERREALADIAKLRDGIAAERLKLGDLQSRPGLEQALRAFANDKALRGAQKALGNGDLTAFDDDMQKLANRAESSDRRAAREALEEAAKAAREKGAKGLAEALEAERRMFEKRQARADAVRELAQAMKGKLSAEANQDLRDFASSGDPQTELRLEQALERALEGLSAEERKRLAERMQKQLEQADAMGSPETRKQLADLARKLSREDGIEDLKKQLEELAKPENSADAERERGLDDADRGGSEAERGLGATPIPSNGDGSPIARAEPDNPGAARGAGGPGGALSRAPGDHQGATPEVAGRELRSKADAHLQAGAALHGASLGRAPARAGETANQLGTGTLRSARQTEVGAVDHADIPEEYREQVGRYFEP